MAAPASQSQFTTLLSNRLLSHVERMRMDLSRRFTNRSRGEHIAAGRGNSNEFKDYRDYVAGDDVRFVDWNIFARLQRPYVKLFHQEEEIHLAILVDVSSSMDFEGKAQRALQLAAGMGVMGLMAGERVSVHVFDDAKAGTRVMPTARGRGKRRHLFDFLEGVTPGGDGTVEQGVEAMLRTHRGRGSLVILSDFLTQGDLSRAFGLAFSAGLVPSAIQLLGPSELDPDLASDLRLVDCETRSTLDISGTGELVDLYHDYLNALVAKLEGLCKNRGGRFLCLDTALTAEFIFNDVFRRRGWAR